MSVAAYLSFSCPPRMIAKVTHWVGILAPLHGLSHPDLPKAIGSTLGRVLCVHFSRFPSSSPGQIFAVWFLWVYPHEACPSEHALKSNGQNTPFPLTSGVVWTGALTDQLASPGTLLLKQEGLWTLRGC